MKISLILCLIFSVSCQSKPVSQLSNKQLFGQMVMLGIKDKIFSENEKRWFSDYGIGSILLLRRNIPSSADSLISVIKSYQSSQNEKALIAIDQENGWISRLHGIVTELPNNYALGRLNEPEITTNVGKMSGKEMLALGIHWSLAPVADVNSNPKNPIIGVRSFGENKEIVKAHTISYIKGLNQSNVLSSIKHFPGHGDTAFDSHYDKVMIYKSEKELRNIDLVPFSFLGNKNYAQPTSVMIGHILLPEIDTVPATISKKIINFVPNKFKGLRVADELEMNALAKFYDPYKSVVTMIENGMDVIIMARALKKRVNVDSLFSYIDDYANKHSEFRKTLISSVKKINTLKKAYKNHIPSLKEFNSLKKIHKPTASDIFLGMNYLQSNPTHFDSSTNYTFTDDKFTQKMVKKHSLLPSKNGSKSIQFINKKTKKVTGDILISIENPYILDKFDRQVKFCFYNRYAPVKQILNTIFQEKK